MVFGFVGTDRSAFDELLYENLVGGFRVGDGEEEIVIDHDPVETIDVLLLL